MVRIHSKDIYYITRDVLRTIEPKVMNHGSRTAYILSKMLLCMEKYEMYEIAEFAFLGTLHDIGAYKTEDLNDQLHYETKEVMPHSIYGYLYFLNLTPFKDRAKIILYHHTDYDKMPKGEIEYEDVAQCLNLAEKVDIFSNALGEKFNLDMFEKQSGTKFSPLALKLLYGAEKKYNMLEKLASGEYRDELDEIIDYMIFTDEEKDEFLYGLSYLSAFKSEAALMHVAMCVQISLEIANRLDATSKEKEALYYSALLHDIGMCIVPGEIPDSLKKLSDEEKEKINTHLEAAKTILEGKVPDVFMEIILAHHEREDGSGYPKRLHGYEMSQAQKILQVSDVIASMVNLKDYGEAKTTDEIVAFLKENVELGKLNEEIVRIASLFMDEILTLARKSADERLKMYEKLKYSYSQTYRMM